MKNKIKKKQKSWLQKLFHYTATPVRENKASISFPILKKMARTKEHEDILKLIENETIESVRKAWIDYFLEKTKSYKSKKSH